MLRIALMVFLLSVVFSCARKDSWTGVQKLSGRSGGGLVSQDPVAELDSTYYIGYVDYFPETHEFYTAVFYREGREYPDEDLLESKLDSVIVYDDDWGRERLPIAEAGELLVLEGLDTLAIYNRMHEEICKCPLTRIEYVWNGLESYFIAVFKADDDFPGQTQELYGISADFPGEYQTMFMAEELRDDTFNRFLLRKMDAADTSRWSMRHYRLTPPEAMYSVLSSWSADGNRTRSYLTYFERNKVEILNEEVDNFHYLNILPIPVYMNGKPLLLVSVGYPSSDVLWDYLAGYDGSQYEAINYNRIHLKDINPAFSAISLTSLSRP